MPPAGLLAGNPALLGLPTFIVGSVALGLSLAGYIPAGVLGAPLAIILLSNGLFLVIATIWAIAVGQGAVASVFGIFAAFWLSYGALVLGILHNWYGLVVPAANGAPAVSNVVPAVKLFLLSWLVTIVLLTLASLRLPSAFTLVFVLVDIALLLLIAYSQAVPSSGLIKTAGYAILAFALVGAYLYFDALSAGTGGRSLPLGRPVIR